MNIDIFKNRTPQFMTEDHSRRSSVCIPVVEVDGQECLLFTVRSSKIGSQPGDVCFPGGKIEKDESPQEAALREIQEELLITSEQVKLVGPADIFTSMGIIVYPYVCRLDNYANTYSIDEVMEVFAAPISCFVGKEPESHIVHQKEELPEDFPYEKIVGGKDYHWRDRRDEVIFYEYEGHIIWGLTAKILRSFIRTLTKDYIELF